MDIPLAKVGTPQVKEARSFLEIVGNFSDPREVVREAISNALDWGATAISVKVSEDALRSHELVIEIKDNGVGLDRGRFEAFWNLADSPGLVRDEFGKKVGGRTGEKGHGTKTYWKCREIEVESLAADQGSAGWHVLAVMKEPVNTLKQGKIPNYEYADAAVEAAPPFTRVTIKGYQAQSKESFRHEELADYVRWFTKFGSIELQVGHDEHKDKRLELQGLGRRGGEVIPFGHPFPATSDNIPKLRAKYQDDWPNYYVKKWVFPDENIPGYPSSTFDFVFYLEGTSAKQMYNPMLRRKGRKPQRWHYTVSERYGLYVCKDWIPLPASQRVNEWISEKSEWTLYHAFLNCQDFQLTANRGSIGNTERDFVLKIREAVEEIFKERVKKSEAYKAYDDAIELTKTQSAVETTTEEEREDLEKRHYWANKKHVTQYRPKERPLVVLTEPREEVEVLMLFSIVAALEPKLFEFNIVDYSTHRGIDALCTMDPPGGGLRKGNLRYVEFKKALTRDLTGHTFRNLAGIVCWECNLEDGTPVTDLAGEHRVLKVTHTTGVPASYILPAPPDSVSSNIKVYVLREYLGQRLGVEFKPRQS
ncbi:MAG: ATP-binding protein [Chloroflexota bacterium]|nr:ATP-binding protein [Chloroflexota bacterium]